MNDPFLHETRVATEHAAMSNAIMAALGRNKTYRDEATDEHRAQFRSALANMMRQESKAYSQAVSDEEHCATIRRISDAMSQAFTHVLIGGRFRYGTSQKAFNLYLKFLWRLGTIPPPPQCPVDSIVLSNGGIDAAWTKSDSEAEYRQWIARLRWKGQTVISSGVGISGLATRSSIRCGCWALGQHGEIRGFIQEAVACRTLLA